MPNGNSIIIKGAREHNLQDIDINIPRNKVIVITGISGSGKSTLAFDTIYAEGKRRFIESLSSYARQFMEQMHKPDVEHIEGLPPTIAIEQRSANFSPRSTVATVTEIYDYMRVLFARVGEPFCFKCNRKITAQTSQQIIEHIMNYRPGKKIVISARVINGKKGYHREVLEKIKQKGYIRVKVDGEYREIEDLLKLSVRDKYYYIKEKKNKKILNISNLKKNVKHTIDIIIDRVVISQNSRNRIADSIEKALDEGNGVVYVALENGEKWKEEVFSEAYSCPKCNINIEEISPRSFSFNSPYGACPSCDGLGSKMELDEELIIPDRTVKIGKGPFEAWYRCGKRLAIYYNKLLWDFIEAYNLDPETPFNKLDEEVQQALLYGKKSKLKSFKGVMLELEGRFYKTQSDYVKKRIMEYMSESPCPLCKGARLKREVLSVKIQEKNIDNVVRMDVNEAISFFNELVLNKEQEQIAKPLLKEIKSRLEFIKNVGLGYLHLNRKTSTLAGGEAQRIKLASQISSGIVGVCYVLDEPTIGLHSRDNARLISTIKRLKQIGNTVIIVEHDEDTISSADYMIDIGPGAGKQGGKVVTAGPLKEVLSQNHSLTVQYLNKKLNIAIPSKRRKIDEKKNIAVYKCAENNLKNIDVKFPLGVLTCVSGVSGSGKSSLVIEILYKALMRKLFHSKLKPGKFDYIDGIDLIDKIVMIDQAPIGRTPRSNPATYTGCFTEIRKLFAMTKEAKIQGYSAGRFSFNIKGGRCEACEGQGSKVISMHFLPDVYVTCQVCKGQRYNNETLRIKYKDKSISDILNMTVEEGLSFFKNFPKILSILTTLDDVGLGYIPLGQFSTTLSGGEAQRIKLATELTKRNTGNTVYILDEPTTGLHIADISKLMDVLNKLVDKGNTVIIIEHNLHVLKCADYIIDLGPEGGDQGGKIIISGTPEKIAKSKKSYTGKFLKKYLS